jgi:hypothetical protein
MVSVVLMAFMQSGMHADTAAVRTAIHEETERVRAIVRARFRKQMCHDSVQLLKKQVAKTVLLLGKTAVHLSPPDAHEIAANAAFHTAVMSNCLDASCKLHEFPDDRPTFCLLAELFVAAMPIERIPTRSPYFQKDPPEKKFVWQCMITCGDQKRSAQVRMAALSVWGSMPRSMSVHENHVHALLLLSTTVAAHSLATVEDVVCILHSMQFCRPKLTFALFGLREPDHSAMMDTVQYPVIEPLLRVLVRVCQWHIKTGRLVRDRGQSQHWVLGLLDLLGSWCNHASCTVDSAQEFQRFGAEVACQWRMTSPALVAGAHWSVHDLPQDVRRDVAHFLVEDSKVDYGSTRMKRNNSTMSFWWLHAIEKLGMLTDVAECPSFALALVQDSKNTGVENKDYTVLLPCIPHMPVFPKGILNMVRMDKDKRVRRAIVETLRARKRRLSPMRVVWMTAAAT